MQRVAVHQRHHALPGGDVVARKQFHVGDGAVDGGSHLGALEIELGQRPIRHGLVVGRLRLQLGRNDLLQPLLRDHETWAQAAVTLQIGIGLFERSASAGDGRIGLLQREHETRPIDAEDHVSAPHRLVILDQHLGHKARHIGRDLDHLGADAPIACPRLVHVVRPKAIAHPDRGSDREARHDETTQKGKKTCHDTYSLER